MIKAVKPSDVQESVSVDSEAPGLFVLWSGAVFMLIFCEIYLHLQSLFLCINGTNCRLVLCC